MKSSPINNIISHSLVDGPGNRTSIFTQGCNLRCGYCHNPETQEVFKKGQCDENIKWMTTDEIYKIIENDAPFIDGITVSGGEAMLHPEFLEELFTKVQKLNLTTLIDSSGTVDFEKYPKLLDLTSGVMLDIKSWDCEVFQKLTKGKNDIVKKNLKYLAERDKIEEIRIVVIPGEVDVEDTLHGIKETIGLKVEKIPLKLIKFRAHGVIEPRFMAMQAPTDEYLSEMKDLAIEIGFKKFR